MLFTELPLEILINIFDFVLSNKFNILKLRLINKYILNVVKLFLKIKRSEKEKFNFILSERNTKYPKKLKLITNFIYATATNDPLCEEFILNNRKIIINKHFDEEIKYFIKYNLKFSTKIEKLGEKSKISSHIFDREYKSSYKLKFKNFEFIDFHDGEYDPEKFKKCIFREGLQTMAYRKFTNCKIYKRLNLNLYTYEYIENDEFVSEIKNFTKNNRFFNKEGKEVDIQNCNVNKNEFSVDNTLLINLDGFIFFLNYITY